MTIGDPVIFDWSGSLQLARKLWELAGRLEALSTSRGVQARSALVDWSGQKSVDFSARIAGEQADCIRLSHALRAEADGWAIEWTKAMDNENMVRYQLACQRVRDDRSALDKIGGFFVGHDDLPPQPRSARQPTAPGFVATRQLADFSAY